MHQENFWNAYMTHFSWYGLFINIYYFFLDDYENKSCKESRTNGQEVGKLENYQGGQKWGKWPARAKGAKNCTGGVLPLLPNSCSSPLETCFTMFVKNKVFATLCDPFIELEAIRTKIDFFILYIHVQNQETTGSSRKNEAWPISLYLIYAPAPYEETRPRLRSCSTIQ